MGKKRRFIYLQNIVSYWFMNKLTFSLVQIAREILSYLHKTTPRNVYQWYKFRELVRESHVLSKNRNHLLTRALMSFAFFPLSLVTTTLASAGEAEQARMLERCEELQKAFFVDKRLEKGEITVGRERSKTDAIYLISILVSISIFVSLDISGIEKDVIRSWRRQQVPASGSPLETLFGFCPSFFMFFLIFYSNLLFPRCPSKILWVSVS